MIHLFDILSIFPPVTIRVLHILLLSHFTGSVNLYFSLDHSLDFDLKVNVSTGYQIYFVNKKLESKMGDVIKYWR